MIVFEFHSKFSLIECRSLALRQWQDWMDLNQNLWGEMKKRKHTWIVIYAHKLFVSHLLLILSRPDEDRKKIPRLAKMNKKSIVLWFCAKKQNVGHLNIKWQRTDGKKERKKRVLAPESIMISDVSREKEKCSEVLEMFCFRLFVGNGNTKSVFVFTI